MEFKGTKGEWKSEGYPEDSNGFISIAIPTGHITVYGGCTEVMTKQEAEKHIIEAEANAQLIAAAPELLEACKMARIEIEKGTADTLTVDVLEKAINKALGQ